MSSFLPTIAAANEKLEKEREEGKLGERNIERLQEGEEGEERRYIEMVSSSLAYLGSGVSMTSRAIGANLVSIEQNLGLGVLEEKRDSDGRSSESGSDSDGSTLGEDESRYPETDVFRKLMGNTKRKERPRIEIVGGA